MFAYFIRSAQPRGRALLAAAFGIALWCAATACLAQQVPFAGHYRVESGGSRVLLKVAADGRVALVVAGTAGHTEWAPQVVRSNVVMGTLDDGRVWSVGLSFGRMMMSIGTELANLTPVAADEFALAAIEARKLALLQNAQAGSTDAAPSLGGLALSTASSSGGYFEGRDYVFCSNGSFRYTKSFSTSGGAGEKQYAGRWQQSGGQLDLFYSDGKRGALPLRRLADDVFELDGVRFVAKRAKQCR